ncbi:MULTISPECIES: DUF5995 family protein [unclassified Streptomyces]|uniref:DUF5995 family protein n=1 Tax=unclassified Streptomyces TaxID=2593676 RepID=UPI00382AAD68
MTQTGHLPHADRFAAPLGPVVRRMRALRADLPARDGIAVFNRVYLEVTEEIARLLGRGAFGDPRAAATLDVLFAARYLAAVDAASAGRRPPDCWRPLFQYRRHPGVHPLQFALAGINAHIGHDLALAVMDSCRRLGVEPAALERDFDRVGDTLAALEERIREELMPGPDLLEVAHPLTHLLASWSLERAREASWSAARVLWQLRELPGLVQEFTDRLDSGVGLVNRCLLTPLSRSD